jgi:integrase
VFAARHPAMPGEPHPLGIRESLAPLDADRSARASRAVPSFQGFARRFGRTVPKLDWVVTHTYRKTTATSIKEAGLDDLAASDQLGHAHVSMTQNVYYGRNKIRREVADVLDQNIG